MDIIFHIPDFTSHLRLNWILDDTIKAHRNWFRDGVKIGSVYGTFPGMLWNGGRFSHGGCDERSINMILTDFQKRNIPIRFTFTNLMLKKEHLGNAYCNKVLRMADNGLNEVIVADPLLEDYIRENYGNYKITSSTCKQLEDTTTLENELEKDYSLVVLDYNWNNDYERLEKIPHKEKCEILINPCCTPHCQRRGEHYRAIGAEQIKFEEHMKNPMTSNRPFPTKPYECPHMNVMLYDRLDLPTHITAEDLYDKYIPMGFNQFKIEGRGICDVEVLENYIYYMVKPEFKDKARLHMSRALTRRVKNF